MIELQGRARRFGDDINTDYIITSTRKRATLDESVLRNYLLETIDPGFAATVVEGDILVAGRNFGCGSAMEVAATVILGAGIKAVLALSFARSFYRNAINNGLLPITCDTSGIAEGHRVAVGFVEERSVVTNQATGDVLPGEPFAPFLLDILEEGGLVPYLRRRGRWDVGDATGQAKTSPKS